MPNISIADAVTLFSNTKSSFVSLETVSEQKEINKTNGERAADKKVLFEDAFGIKHESIEKRTKFVGLVGTAIQYEDLVNNRLLKEAVADGKKKAQLTFSADERKWGKRVNGAIVEHNGEYYLTVLCVANNVPTVTYEVAGKPFDPKDSKYDAFRAAPKKAPTNQALDNPVIYRDYKMTSVKKFSLGGQTYEIV